MSKYFCDLEETMKIIFLCESHKAFILKEKKIYLLI